MILDSGLIQHKSSRRPTEVGRGVVPFLHTYGDDIATALTLLCCSTSVFVLHNAPDSMLVWVVAWTVVVYYYPSTRVSVFNLRI